MNISKKNVIIFVLLMFFHSNNILVTEKMDSIGGQIITHLEN